MLLRGGIVATSGTFSTYLGGLRRNRLIDQRGTEIVASDIPHAGRSSRDDITHTRLRRGSACGEANPTNLEVKAARRGDNSAMNFARGPFPKEYGYAPERTVASADNFGGIW